MSMNLMQLADDVVVFISEMDWPEMYPIGYDDKGAVISKENKMTMLETARGTIMAGMFSHGTTPVFKEIQPDEFLIRKIAMEFMSFCSVKHTVKHPPNLAV